MTKVSGELVMHTFDINHSNDVCWLTGAAQFAMWAPCLKTCCNSSFSQLLKALCQLFIATVEGRTDTFQFFQFLASLLMAPNANPSADKNHDEDNEIRLPRPSQAYLLSMQFESHTSTISPLMRWMKCYQSQQFPKATQTTKFQTKGTKTSNDNFVHNNFMKTNRT